MNELVLIDSSVWISFYRPQGSLDTKEMVTGAIREDVVITCGLIKAEVLQGTTNQKSFDIINNDFGAFRQIEITEDIFESAAKLAFDLRRKGITVPMIDIIISVLAIKNNLTLWHSDNHYEMIKKAAKIDTQFLS